MYTVAAALFITSAFLLVGTGVAGANTSGLSRRRKQILRTGFLLGAAGTAGVLIVMGLQLFGLIGVIAACPIGVVVIVGLLRAAPFIALGKNKARLSTRDS